MWVSIGHGYSFKLYKCGGEPEYKTVSRRVQLEATCNMHLHYVFKHSSSASHVI